jgi:hypothetical protein
VMTSPTAASENVSKRHRIIPFALQYPRLNIRA